MCIAARNFEVSDNDSNIRKHYRELFDFICKFFTSKEYLGTYNPIFFQKKDEKEKDEVLKKIFTIDDDIEKDIYEIILHLLYKEIIKDRYENLRNLQKIIKVIKNWKEFLISQKSA